MSDTPPRHIVAAGALVRNADGNVLMIRSPRRGWEFPGGQVEQGESITDGVAREVWEETGVRVSVGALVGVYSNVRSHIVMFGFLCTPTGGDATSGPEAVEIGWFAPDEALARVTHPALRDRLRDFLEFAGTVVYRSYSFETYGMGQNYTVHEERAL